jgi:O-antigen/teichoic acid export membrane protein
MSRSLFSGASSATRSSRLRGEAAWVVAHKVLELGFNILTLKVLTTLMRDTPATYGELNLALTATVLLANVVLLPVNQAYLRAYHGANTSGGMPAITAFLLRWYGCATLAVAVACAVWTKPIASHFGLEPWTPLATGLVFLANRWRMLGIEVLEVGRKRRAWTLANVGFLALQLLAVAMVAACWRPSATNALLAYAAAAGFFALFSVTPLARIAREGGRDAIGTFGPMIVTYGIPAALLLLLQAVQSFADRYVLGVWADLNAVGRYVAAYQVCGVPYMFLMGALQALCVPIAFQHAQDVDDPQQVWAADRVIMASVAAYAVLGIIGLGAFMLWGEQVLRLCTAAEFGVPWMVLVVLAAGRFLQGLSLLLQNFFAVHQIMSTSLGFRTVGAALTLPICWVAIRGHGMYGAAVASVVSVVLYGAIVTFGPGGCFWLVRDARRRSEGSRLPLMATESAA